MQNILKNASETIKRNSFIIESLVTKDFKLKYRRSLLGVVWSVLNPLLMMVVLTAVFQNVFRFDTPNYPMYLILGQILFTFMSGATSDAMLSIIESAPLIKKVRIDKLVFPLEKVLFNLLNFTISLVAVAIVMLATAITPSLSLVCIPLLLVYMVLFCCGIGLLLSALTVFFRDVIHLWGVVLTAWTYATPIFYPSSILPDWGMQIMFFNPMYHYVSYFREIVLYGQFPNLESNAVCFLMAIITFLVGLLVFRKTQNKFILYV